MSMAKKKARQISTSVLKKRQNTINKTCRHTSLSVVQPILRNIRQLLTAVVAT